MKTSFLIILIVILSGLAGGFIGNQIQKEKCGKSKEKYMESKVIVDPGLTALVFGNAYVYLHTDSSNISDCSDIWLRLKSVDMPKAVSDIKGSFLENNIVLLDTTDIKGRRHLSNPLLGREIIIQPL